MSDKLDPAVVARYPQPAHFFLYGAHFFHPSGGIFSEAKGIHQSLKELLKTKEPFDKEVDFQRKK